MDVASICMKLKTQTTLVRKKNEEKRPLGRSRNRWEDIIKVCILNKYCVKVEFICLSIRLNDTFFFTNGGFALRSLVFTLM